jgi:hypothetical protein
MNPTAPHFRFEFTSGANQIVSGGDVVYDEAQKKWKATIIAQRVPEIRFEAWDEEGPTAALLAVAKYLGRPMTAESVADR